MSVEFTRFSLFKRRNGLYSILYYHHGHRRWKSTNATTKPEALAILSQFQEALNVGGAAISLQEFTSRFLSYAETCYSPKTVELYRHVFLRFGNLVGNLYLSELTAEHFDRYKAQRLKEKIEFKKSSRNRSAVSVNIELRALRAAMSTARRWKVIPSNPFEGVTFAAVPETAPVFFTADDFQRLLNCIPEGWLKDIVVFAVLTGLRQGEILNLRWNDVDLARRLVNIQTSTTFKTKGGRRRTIPLSESAMALLQSRQVRSVSDFVFTLHDRPILRGWMQHLFKRRVKAAGLSPRLHFHSLRHTHASWLVQNGASLYEVQKLLGHSNPRVTQVYAHLQPTEMHVTVNKITVGLN